MRLDHIAYRTSNRLATANFFIQVFGYKIQTEFPIVFDDGSTAKCIALEPPEKLNGMVPWVASIPVGGNQQEYHLPPEIFVSDGSDGSIIAEWVKQRGGVGGVHHMAYQVDDVESTMKEWIGKGYAEFSSDVVKCPGLNQVFTKPSQLTGVIYELISRGQHGFCAENVKALMEASTKK